MIFIIAFFMMIGIFAWLVEDLYILFDHKDNALKYSLIIILIIFEIVMIKYLQKMYYQSYSIIMLVHLFVWMVTYMYPLKIFKK